MLVAAALLTLGSASAQVSYQLGFMATSEEWTNTTTLGGISASKTSKNNYSGFMVGADYNMNIAGGFNVAPGVAMELSLDNKDNDVKYKEFNLSYVPVDFHIYDISHMIILCCCILYRFQEGLPSRWLFQVRRSAYRFPDQI